MKQVGVFVMVLLLLLLPSSAHPGKTDANGGHYNKSTGEYHYHHGFPEHQHENGSCPYDYEDQTENSHGRVTLTEDDDEPTHYEIPKKETDELGGFFEVVGAAIFGGLLLMISFIKNRMRRKKEQEMRCAEEQRIWESERAELISKYGNKTQQQIASMCGMPDGIEIGTDGWPKEIGVDGWGKSMTMYISPSGTAFHERATCTKPATIPIHVTMLAGRAPCGKCHPKVPNLRWFWEYRNVIQLLERYNIVLEESDETNEVQLKP